MTVCARPQASKATKEGGVSSSRRDQKQNGVKGSIKSTSEVVSKCIQCKDMLARGNNSIHTEVGSVFISRKLARRVAEPIGGTCSSDLFHALPVKEVMEQLSSKVYHSSFLYERRAPYLHHL